MKRYVFDSYISSNVAKAATRPALFCVKLILLDKLADIHNMFVYHDVCVINPFYI